MTAIWPRRAGAPLHNSFSTWPLFLFLAFGLLQSGLANGPWARLHSVKIKHLAGHFLTFSFLAKIPLLLVLCHSALLAPAPRNCECEVPSCREVPTQGFSRYCTTCWDVLLQSFDAPSPEPALSVLGTIRLIAKGGEPGTRVSFPLGEQRYEAIVPPGTVPGKPFEVVLRQSATIMCQGHLRWRQPQSQGGHKGARS